MNNFIEKARKIHKDKYDYSQVSYVNNRTKVKIICPIHGEFFQIPHNHCAGKGCKKCSSLKVSEEKSCTVQDFVLKAQQVHGQKYTYDEVSYVNNRTKVKIICPIHGEFFQIPINHYKYGCEKCGRQNSANLQQHSLNDFVKRSVEKHGNKYIYSHVFYHGAHKKIKIICRLHGPFMQTANSHLRGRGCPKCKQGEFHPRFGKPAISSGYHGLYKETVFRSLAELFWILDCEAKNIEFIGLDQNEARAKWQVMVFYGNKKHTYCADFYLPQTNEIIDIKPKWKADLDKEKLDEGKREYEKLGYTFCILDSDLIKPKISVFKMMVKQNKIKLHPSSMSRFERRFGKI